MAETAEEKAAREANEAREKSITDLIAKGVRKAVAEIAEEKKKKEPPERENKGYLEQLAEAFGIK